MIFVTKVFLERAICQNKLLLSMILTNHSNVIFVSKFFSREQFKETYVCDHERKKKIWMSLCNQKISPQKNLRKHISEIHENRTFMWTRDYSSYKGSSTKHIASVHNAKKSFKCDICDPSFYKKKHIVKVHESKKPFTCNLLMSPKLFTKESLRRHISAVHWKVIWLKKTYSCSSWWKNKLFKCSICEALVLKNLPWDSTSINSSTGVFSNK